MVIRKSLQWIGAYVMRGWHAAQERSFDGQCLAVPQNTGSAGALSSIRRVLQTEW